MNILERYNSAVHAPSLKQDPNSIFADLDVLGAAGLAARHEPMGIALARMLAGGGDTGVVSVMADAGWRRARWLNVKLNRFQSVDVAKSVLAWIRDGRCDCCGGTGFRIIPGTPSLGDDCPACKGTGKIPFESQFRQEWRELARWLSSEVERSQANAAFVAMQKIAPMLDL